MLDELYLAPKLSSPLSLSRSLPVKWRGLTSPQVPVMDWPSPKGRLVIDSPDAVQLRPHNARASADVSQTKPFEVLPREVLKGKDLRSRDCKQARRYGCCRCL